MKTTISAILFLMLAGCNLGSTGQMGQPGPQGPQGPAGTPAPAASTAALRAEVTQLERQVSKLSIIGKVVGTAASVNNGRGVAHYAITNAVSFGPCPDMGVLLGFTPNPNNQNGGVLDAQFQAFKSCMGYVYQVDTKTGNIAPAARIFWDGQNCTGNLFEWEAGGAGYDTGALQDGVVFLNPADDITQVMVIAHQTPQSILIQSVMLDSNHICQSDVETQLMYQVSAYSLQTTGVASGSVGNYSLSSP